MNTFRNARASRLVSGVAVAGLLLSAAACASSGSSAASGGTGKNCTTSVLLVDNFSGSGSQNGQANLAGAKVAVQHVNSTGGVLGCKLALATADDNSNYSTALSLIQSDTSSTTYAMVSDSDYSATSVAPYLARQNILSISAASAVGFSEPGADYPTLFDVDFLGARVMTAAMSYVLKQGYKRIAVIVDNTNIGAADLQVIKPMAAAGGATITDTEQVDLSGVDFTSAVERARASNPQVLVMDLSYTAAGHLETDLHNSGWKIPVVAGQTTSATSFNGLVPASYLTGQIVFGPSSMAYPSTPATQTFLNSLKSAGVSVNTFLFGYTSEYDALIEFAWAANQTHSLNATTLATKLHDSGSVPIPGLVGGSTTGYTPDSGEWDAAHGLAEMKLGYDNLGRLQSVGPYLTAPALPAGFFK